MSLTIQYHCGGASAASEAEHGRTEGMFSVVPVTERGHPSSKGIQGIRGYKMSYPARDSSAQLIRTCT